MLFSAPRSIFRVPRSKLSSRPLAIARSSTPRSLRTSLSSIHSWRALRALREICFFQFRALLRIPRSKLSSRSLAIARSSTPRSLRTSLSSIYSWRALRALRETCFFSSAFHIPSSALHFLHHVSASSHTPSIFAPHFGQWPSRSRFSRTRNPLRLINTLPHSGQRVSSP